MYDKLKSYFFSFVYDILDKLFPQVQLENQFKRSQFLLDSQLCKLTFVYNNQEYIVCIPLSKLVESSQDSNNPVLLFAQQDNDTDITPIIKKYLGPNNNFFNNLGFFPKLNWILPSNNNNFEIVLSDGTTLDNNNFNSFSDELQIKKNK